MRYKIEYVKKEIPGAKGYLGMNQKAAKELHIPFHHKHPAHTVVILKKQSPKMLKSTEVHEEVENYLMRIKHLHYHPATSKHSAHHIALQYEKLHKPFSIQRVNGLLKHFYKH